MMLGSNASVEARSPSSAPPTFLKAETWGTRPCSERKAPDTHGRTHAQRRRMGHPATVYSRSSTDVPVLRRYLVLEGLGSIYPNVGPFLRVVAL
jgi:hypothetical protein